MAAMINLKASHKTPTINVGCNPVTTVRIENSKPEGPTMVRYPPVDNGVAAGEVRVPNSAFVSVSPGAVSTFTDTTERPIPLSEIPEIAALQRENAVLRLIIDIQHSNPLIVNKYIIADDATLIKLVSLLCNASEVHIDAEDVECGCTAKNTYRKVHAIFVVVNGETKNLKYDFSDVMYTLKELHISTKFVF